MSDWNTFVENDFSLGIIRDAPRVGIPKGGLYDALDVFVHRPGVIFKRGGITVAGPKMTDFSPTKGNAVAYAPFPSGVQLVALADDGHFYKITSGAATGIPNDGGTPSTIDKPTFFSGAAESILVVTDKTGTSVPYFYDGNAADASQAFPGGATSISSGMPGSSQYTLSLVGPPSAGTFRLALSAQEDPLTGGGSGLASPLLFITASIAYNASAATVVSKINTALAGTGVTVSGTGGSLPGTPVVLTFPAGYSPAVWPSSLTGGYPQITNTTSSSGTVDAVSVPTARLSETYLQRLILANSANNPNRIWFSPVLNVTRTGWDLTNSWLDVASPITGLASLVESLLVFTANGFYRLIGTSPPPESDMSVEPISEIGCTDPRSITISEGRCIFANPRGVFITGGVAPVSLMEDRIESYWQSLFSGYSGPHDGGSWVISTGIYARRFLFVTVLNGTTQVETLVCDLPRRAWVRVSNLDALMYAGSVGQSEELAFVNQGSVRVFNLSTLFNPSSTVKNDVGIAGGSETATPVTCSWATRPLAQGTGLKAFGDVEVLLDMRDSASDDPTLAVTVAAGVEASSATAVAESPLGETTDLARRRVTVSKDSECVTLAFSQSNASSKTECYGIEWTERPYGPQAEGQ